MRLLVGLLILAGCVQNQSEVIKGENDLLIYSDKNHGVICYRISGQDGISCLQIEVPKPKVMTHTFSNGEKVNCAIAGEEFVCEKEKE